MGQSESIAAAHKEAASLYAVPSKPPTAGRKVVPRTRTHHVKAQRKEFHVKLFKNPPELVLALVLAAVKKAHNHWTRTLSLGFLGGMWVGFSGSMSIGLAGGIDPSIVALVPVLPKLLISLTFPITLLLILVVGGELFTGNVMIMLLGLVSQQVTIFDVLISWLCSYVGNWMGATLMAGAFHYAAVYDAEPWRSFLLSYVHKKIDVLWGVNVLRAMLCNMVVCASVAVATAAEDIAGKMFSIYCIIMIFVMAGFEHCVANMFFVTAGIFQGDPEGHYNNTYGQFIVYNLIPVTLGNILGVSFILVPLLWYNYYLPSPAKLPPVIHYKFLQKFNKEDNNNNNQNEVLSATATELRNRKPDNNNNNNNNKNNDNNKDTIVKVNAISARAEDRVGDSSDNNDDDSDNSDNNSSSDDSSSEEEERRRRRRRRHRHNNGNNNNKPSNNNRSKKNEESN